LISAAWSLGPEKYIPIRRDDVDMRVVNFSPGKQILARSIDEGSGAVKLQFLRVKFGKRWTLVFGFGFLGKSGKRPKAKDLMPD
jgi:hypothetical protein